MKRAGTASIRQFSSSRNRLATVAPGSESNPPSAISPEEVNAIERVEQRLKRLRLIRKAQSSSKSPFPSRFWKETSVKETEDGLEVMLDTRAVRTPNKTKLNLKEDSSHLASSIALEWDNVTSAQQATKNHYIPLTSLTSRSMDIENADKTGDSSLRESLVKNLMGYLSTDTLLCWAPEQNVHDAEDGQQAALRKEQEETAKPVLDYLTTNIWPGITIKPVLETDSIIPADQLPETTDQIRKWVSGLSAWDLAALERAVLASKSLLIAARLVVGWSKNFPEHEESTSFGIEEAACASTLEVNWQTKIWGEVEDSHDVDREDLRRQLGSVVVLLCSSKV